MEKEENRKNECFGMENKYKGVLSIATMASSISHVLLIRISA